MSELESEDVQERFTPQHPLPEAIQKMERDETVCRYCGVSYLIHSEIKALEKKLKAVEKELEHYKGCQERENQLKLEVQVLQDQKGEFEMTITVKDASIQTLTNNLKSKETQCERLRTQKQETEDRLHDAETSNKALKERNNMLERSLPNLQMALRQQKMSLEDVHTFLESRDKQMKEEITILLSHVSNTCQREIKEKDDLRTVISELQARWGDTTSETEEMQSRLARQEAQIQQLDKLFTENKQLQDKCRNLENTQAAAQQQFQETCSALQRENKKLSENNSDLETEKSFLVEKCSSLEHKLSAMEDRCSNLSQARDKLRKELEDAIEKSRSLQMETHQFKEQYRLKSAELEEMTTVQRRNQQAVEMTTQKLKYDLKQRDADLMGAKRELKDLHSKFEQHKQMEAELSRKASKTVNETKDLKESFFKAKEEIDSLKQEREAMITSHQNRIEQLRESFKEKLAEADSWQEKLDAAIQKEKERHARELNHLEKRLKESFVMELEIEKSKYNELMRKYQQGSQETEDRFRAQMQSIESRYMAEISDLNEQLHRSRQLSKEMEDELRREIASLKAIIKDLEGRLGRLDVGNDDLVLKLKVQLRETHQELEDTRQALDNQTKAGETFSEEIKHLQETVQRECEERFELTEALSTAKEELLQLKKPSGAPKYPKPVGPVEVDPHSDNGGYPSMTPRQLTNLSLPQDDPPPATSRSRRSVSEPQPLIPNRPITSKSRVYGEGPKREYTLTNSNTMVFSGDTSNNVRAVGGSSKRTGGSLAENRRRIAAILGRK